jgi:uncharacterized protein
MVGLGTERSQAKPAPRRILITGATGLLGSSLVPYLSADGNVIARLVRAHPRPGASDPGTPTSSSPPGPAAPPLTLTWDPAAGLLDPHSLEGFNAVIHLAGENVGALRWTTQLKDRILQSRIAGTRLLAERLAGLARRPEVLVSASAIGFYGSRGDEVIDETSAPGSGFFASVVQAWEDAAAPARDAGIRVVHLRMGVVLTARGGALARMLPAFRWGLGARFGSGRQCFSWIALDDLLPVFARVLADRSLAGPVNATSPGSVTNAEFTRTLARALRRPALFAVPAWVLRLALGEMAEEMLLSGARVRPSRLLAAGFRFGYPELEPALRHILGSGDA